ncbi:hypothetical protein H310_03952 [Aphanomyces invadans]|uniref:PH domain-containing protein n=1 Tax=Aphanomyces invadans TaxID=157072 RepID=A0A024UF43_9STRA|nr:hypothetical protein H310_03952 [Aphanomyces invadans]ETW04825.1 hypothetical protein H310_03952 [Aphanomyces invadans]|eukprot:XP_008866263.1 hypothetical protein H310_03952 [Aphanomyces invadans]
MMAAPAAAMRGDEGLSKLRLSVASPSSSVSSHGPAMEVVKAGYLSKYNRGKWNAKQKWRQRWFVLENGVLKLFKSAPSLKSRKKAIPRDVFVLGPSSALTFPKEDLPTITPSPFCFAVHTFDDTRSLLLCARSQQEFCEWIAVISATIHPEAPPVVPPTPVYALEQLQELGNKVAAPPVITTSPSFRSIFESRKVALGVGVVLNPLMVLHVDLLITAIALLAAAGCLCFFWTNRHVAASKGNAAVRCRLLSTAPLELAAAVPPLFPLIEPAVEPAPVVCDKRPSTDVGLSRSSKGAVGYVNGTKAFAGCSLTSVAPDLADTAKGSWTQLDATRFNVRRGPNYKKNKVKAPSGPALLELVATDVFRSDLKVDNIGSKIQLPRDADGRTDLLILNTQVPCYTPANPLWGESKTDGVGFNFVVYFSIPSAIRAQLDAKHDPVNPQLRLLKWFLEEDSAVRDRLKAIVMVANPADQKLGRMERTLLDTYNGQPIMTRPEHRFYRGDGYFEVDIDAHIFNYLARKGLTGITQHFGHMVVDFGFVMEGQDDDELPENIFGSGRLCRVDVNTAHHLSFR